MTTRQNSTKFLQVTLPSCSTFYCRDAKYWTLIKCGHYRAAKLEKKQLADMSVRQKNYIIQAIVSYE